MELDLTIVNEKLKKYLPCMSDGAEIACTDAIRTYLEIGQDGDLTTESPELDMFLACMTIRAKGKCKWMDKQERTSE